LAYSARKNKKLIVRIDNRQTWHNLTREGPLIIFVILKKYIILKIWNINNKKIGTLQAQEQYIYNYFYYFLKLGTVLTIRYDQILRNGW
jgi:hypothetical protein